MPRLHEPAAAGAPGSGSAAAGAAILPFRERVAPRVCASCGYPLMDRPSWWNLCIQCFRGAQLYRATQIFLGRRN